MERQSAYKHYSNLAPAGSVVFVTTTCLDFVHVFRDPKLANLMCASLLDDCLYYGAELCAFVVMPHHIHLLCRLPETMSAETFMERIKANAARRIVPRLGPIAGEFNQQRGLNGRTMWMRSFRSIEITNAQAFWLKVRYIHGNPVRAGLCERPEDYPYGSGGFWAELWDEGKGLVYGREVVERFASRDMLKITRPRPSTPASHVGVEG